MKKIYMDEEALNVKVGDTVVVQGNVGTVTEIYEDAEVLNVRVHFVGELRNWGQYQDGMYGGFAVIEPTVGRYGLTEDDVLELQEYSKKLSA